MDLIILYILRPWILLLAIPCWLLVILMLKNQDTQKTWQPMIAPHLLQHLLMSQESNTSTLRPAWLIGIVLSLMVIALSGPAWQKKPVLYKDNQTELVFILKVTESMLEKDLQPNRLTRAGFKMQDILTQRQQLKSALVAYSGSAHLAMPLTTDKQIVSHFAASLQPQIMPVKGDALVQAVILAQQQFNTGGTIMIMTDSISKQQVKQIQQEHSLQHAHIVLYAIASTELLNHVQMQQAASGLDADLVLLSADDTDVHQLLQLIEYHFEQAQNEQQDYQDGGIYLLPPIALLILLWFRPGFIAEAWRLS